MASTGAGLARKVAAWVPAALVVPAVMAAGIRVSLPEEKGEALRELHPVEVGTTWVYAVSDHGTPSGTRMRQVTGQAAVDVDLLDAVTVRSRYTDYPGAGVLDSTIYLGIEGASLNQYGVIANREHLAIDPPAPAYELPVEEGHSWSYDGTVGAAGLRYETTLEEIGDVEVGGRSFDDCAHFVTELQWKYQGEKAWGHDETLEEWTCPGFGPVRTTDVVAEQDLDLAEELVEFHGAAGDWFAGEPAEPTVTAHPGDTLGFDAQRTNAVDGEISDALAWSDGRSARFDFAPVADDEVMVLGERDGEVSAMDHATGEMRWRVRLSGPIVAPPTMAGDRVLVADAEKRLWALSLEDGSARWVRELGDMVTAAPLVAAGQVVVASDDGLVTALDLADGRTAWSVERPSSVRSAPALDGEHVVVADGAGEVTAYALDDGAEVWSRALDGGLLAGPAVSDGRVVVGDDSGVLYGLDAADGGLDWEERTIFYPSEQFAVGDGVLVSVGDGVRLEAYDVTDGDELWDTGIPKTEVAPVIVGDQVVTVDAGGELTVRDLADGSTVSSWRVPLPEPGASATVESDLGLVAGALVVDAELTAEAHNASLYAYPVSSAGARPGVAFDTEVRTVPGTAAGGSVLVGDTLFTPGFDQALYRSTGLRRTEKLFTSGGLLPGVATDGDLVLTQDGTEVLAYPAGGGEPRWRYESGEPYPGMVPAVGGDTVFVPQHGQGLAAVSLADGAERWATKVDLAMGSAPPLPLPGGDVVYGGGALARFDGETGRQRWSILDGVLFSNAAYDDGLVFADVVRNLSPSGLTAIDAGTGEQVWFHENANTQIIVGPEAAEGVVVHPDSQGLVRAYDGRTGKKLWQVQLSTPVAGHPVILDGVVYLSEVGRKEDIFQREYRISAHDLHTGRFLGSYQPPGTAFATFPSVAGSGGAILAPASGRLGSIVMILRPRP